MSVIPSKIIPSPDLTRMSQYPYGGRGYRPFMTVTSQTDDGYDVYSVNKSTVDIPAGYTQPFIYYTEPFSYVSQLWGQEKHIFGPRFDISSIAYNIAPTWLPDETEKFIPDLEHTDDAVNALNPIRPLIYTVTQDSLVFLRLRPDISNIVDVLQVMFRPRPVEECLAIYGKYRQMYEGWTSFARLVETYEGDDDFYTFTVPCFKGAQFAFFRGYYAPGYKSVLTKNSDGAVTDVQVYGTVKPYNTDDPTMFTEDRRKFTMCYWSKSKKPADWSGAEDRLAPIGAHNAISITEYPMTLRWAK